MPPLPILQLPKECLVDSERGMEGYFVSSVASQPGSSSVGDAWLLDGERASRQGPAVFCLLKRLQTPLSACRLPQSSLRMQNTVPIPPSPPNTHPPTHLVLSEKTACVDRAAGEQFVLSRARKRVDMFQPPGLLSSCTAPHSCGIGTRGGAYSSIQTR